MNVKNSFSSSEKLAPRPLIHGGKLHFWKSLWYKYYKAYGENNIFPAISVGMSNELLSPLFLSSARRNMNSHEKKMECTYSELEERSRRLFIFSTHARSTNRRVWDFLQVPRCTKYSKYDDIFGRAEAIRANSSSFFIVGKKDNPYWQISECFILWCWIERLTK